MSKIKAKKVSKRLQNKEKLKLIRENWPEIGRSKKNLKQ
jgi:hypothetical protein